MVREQRDQTKKVSFVLPIALHQRIKLAVAQGKYKRMGDLVEVAIDRLLTELEAEDKC
jgi:Arc/MetJ-type ribon-helix-helix transcriptional regulator